MQSAVHTYNASKARELSLYPRARHFKRTAVASAVLLSLSGITHAQSPSQQKKELEELRRQVQELSKQIKEVLARTEQKHDESDKN